MSCDNMRELMSAHVDGALDPAGEQRLAGHLAACAACRRDLAALKRTVQALHELPPVPPPAGLAAGIRARVRQPRQSRIVVFLSLPQTRVALAASLLVVVTTLGIRQMLSNPRPAPASDMDAGAALVVNAPAAPQTPPPPPAMIAPPTAPARPAAPVVAAPPAEALREKAAAEPRAEEAKRAEVSRKNPPRPVIRAPVDAEARMADALKQQDAAQTVAAKAKFESARDEVAAAPVAANAAAAAPAAEYRALANGRERGGAGGSLAADAVMLDARKPDAAMTLAQPAEAPDNQAVDKVSMDRMPKAAVTRSAPMTGYAAPALAPAAAPSRPTTFAAGSAAPRMRATTAEPEGVTLRRQAADSYTLRTDKIADAAAIVRRYATRPSEQGADGTRAKEIVEAKKDAGKNEAQSVTVDVTLAAADLPALLDELRRAGAQLVSQPAADLKFAAAAAPAPRPAAGARLMGAAPSAAPAAPAAAATMSAAAEAPSGYVSAAPATVAVRFTFLPPTP